MYKITKIIWSKLSFLASSRAPELFQEQFDFFDFRNNIHRNHCKHRFSSPDIIGQLINERNPKDDVYNQQ